jgi:DNA-binding response OmpR family regulator
MEGCATVRVLVIDDSPVDFRLVERALGAQFSLAHATTLAAGLAAAAAGRFDLIILDLCLDDSRGYGTFERARLAVPGLPIIVLSGTEDEELALRAVANGAQDFVRKSGLLDFPLDRTARYAVNGNGRRTPPASPSSSTAPCSTTSRRRRTRATCRGSSPTTTRRRSTCGAGPRG